jgi:hypothetical protein
MKHRAEITEFEMWRRKQAFWVFVSIVMLGLGINDAAHAGSNVWFWVAALVECYIGLIKPVKLWRLSKRIRWIADEQP